MKQLYVFLCALAPLCASAVEVLRVNEVGYLPDDVKVAVYLGDTDPAAVDFRIGGSVPDSVVPAPAWGSIPYAARVYFSSAQSGEHSLTASKGSTLLASKTVRVADDAYSRFDLKELPLNYLRQQRCGYNPVHDRNCHLSDGRRVLSGTADGDSVDVTGGWHDASDYLQYLPTSANTVYQLLFAYSMQPEIWGDAFDASGRPGANGVPDIVDEARWGLEWMCRMNPSDGVYYNQTADDRDHRVAGLPFNDNVDYGWGAGADRPVYPVCGEPYGLQKYTNRSTGEASSVAKFASAFALGAKVFGDIDSEFAAMLSQKATGAFDYALRHPGASQTAPCVSPYFYEEDNWVDDVELAAATLGRLREAAAMGRLEPVTPWMGADSARHYQWYPFVNLGHYIIAAEADSAVSAEFASMMRQGLKLTADRGRGNAFGNGIPFIWCSNNLATAFVTQAMLYRELTGDTSFAEAEANVRHWLFGLNPWGQTMIMLPQDSGISSPVDAHSAMTDAEVAGVAGRRWLEGALVDGPVYDAIYNSLWGVHLRRNDDYALFQGRAVYHDDYSDYSTNEPTMDGTASTTFMLGRLCRRK